MHCCISQMAGLEVDSSTLRASGEDGGLTCREAYPTAALVGLASHYYLAGKHQQLSPSHQLYAQDFMRHQTLQAHLLVLTREQQANLTGTLTAPGSRVASIDAHALLFVRRHLPKLDEDHGSPATGRLMA